MAEITAAGYQDIRDYIQANWKYIEIQDDLGAKIIRIQAGTDPRAVWTHNAGAQTLELTITLKGSDADISPVLPKTFKGSAFFKAASGGSAFSPETFTQFTMQDPADQLVIKHQLQIPQIG